MFSLTISCVFFKIQLAVNKLRRWFLSLFISVFNNQNSILSHTKLPIYSLLSDIFQSLVAGIIAKRAACQISRGVRSVELWGLYAFRCWNLLVPRRFTTRRGLAETCKIARRNAAGCIVTRPVALVINPLENEAPQLAVLSTYLSFSLLAYKTPTRRVHPLSVLSTRLSLR